MNAIRIAVTWYTDREIMFTLCLCMPFTSQYNDSAHLCSILSVFVAFVFVNFCRITYCISAKYAQCLHACVRASVRVCALFIWHEQSERAESHKTKIKRNDDEEEKEK